MAEYKEVMRQYKRLCDTYRDCDGCPFRELENFEWNCGPIEMSDSIEDMDIWETTVMDWARTHPEPVYPTIREFINYIMNKIPGESVSYETRIPENIAKEFNILPMYEKGEWAP